LFDRIKRPSPFHAAGTAMSGILRFCARLSILWHLTNDAIPCHPAAIHPRASLGRALPLSAELMLAVDAQSAHTGTPPLKTADFPYHLAAQRLM
jgi:hypothetical protein